MVTTQHMSRTPNGRTLNLWKNFGFHKSISSVLYTVDHQTLLSILQERFAVTDSALNWFRSYLTGRSGSVHLASDVSDAITVNCGVPQGSSLGRKLFIAYTEELDEVLDQHHMGHHCFADDNNNNNNRISIPPSVVTSEAVAEPVRSRKSAIVG